MVDTLTELETDSDSVVEAVTVIEVDGDVVPLTVRLRVEVGEKDAVGVTVTVPDTVTDDVGDTVTVGDTDPVSVDVGDGDEHATLPCDENCPAPQLPLQLAVVRPALLPYSPALQFVQSAAPASEYCPAGQRKAVGDVDCAGHA